MKSTIFFKSLLINEQVTYFFRLKNKALLVVLDDE